MTRLLALALLVSGCGGFGVDRQPTGGNSAPDGSTASDGGTDDLAVIPPAADLSGTLPGADLAMPATGPMTIVSGTFVKGQQNGGDTGSGSGSLVRNADGSESAVFGADFKSSQVPAGEVVLTSRSSIGTGGIVAGDLDLGPLKSAMGAQQYSVPGGDGGRRNLFVYCTTYGIDVTVARLQ